MKLTFTAAARADLLGIGDAIALNSPRRALTFVDEPETRCRHLQDTPKAYPLVGDKSEKGLRRAVHGNYLIFYRLDGDRLTILRVLSGRMNVDVIMGLSK